MAFTGLDLGIQESIFLLCAIVLGGVICSVVFLQCCRVTAEGRAENWYEIEHQRVLEEQRVIQAELNEAKESKNAYDESLSISPVYIELQSSESPKKLYNRENLINNINLAGTSGNLPSAPPRPKPQINIDTGIIASAPPKPKPEINIELPKGSEQNNSPWNSLSDWSVSFNAIQSSGAPQAHLPLHAAWSKSFMEEKNPDEKVEPHGTMIHYATSDVGASLTRMSTKKYTGRLIDPATPRLKLGDILDSESDDTPVSSFDYIYERKITEL